jgi:hypothetical protein
VTQLRQKMLEELQRRNYSDRTAHSYVRIVAAFAKHFGRSPDELGPDELRSYQAYLLQERKLAVNTVILNSEVGRSMGWQASDKNGGWTKRAGTFASHEKWLLFYRMSG